MPDVDRIQGKQASDELSTSESVAFRAHWITRLLATVLFLIFIVVGQFSFADSTSAKNVLVLFSFSDRSYNPALDLLKTTVRSNVQVPVNFYVEYLESQRFGNTDYEESLSGALQRAYAGQRMDVVVVYAYPAFLFAAKHRDRLFPGASIVFSGVDPRRIDSQNLGPGVTGITFSGDARGTLDLALRLHPDTKNVAMVTGTSDFETYWLKVIHEEFRPYETRVKLIELVGLPNDQLLKQVRALPRETIVFFDLTPRESEQPVLGRDDILALVGRDFPTYCMHSVNFCLGGGGVGGSFADLREQRVKAGELTARILSGEKAENIPVMRDSGARPYLDWRQLRRWDIQNSALPHGSIVLYREPGIWERYKWFIISVTALIAVQALLILVLLRRRKRAEDKIRQRNAVLSGINTIFEEALKCESEEDLGQTCLHIAERITDSKFGFMGEIGPDGLLHDIAISGSGWDPGNFKIHGLYGQLLNDGKRLLTNDFARHPDSIGTPPAHPWLKALLGAPLTDSGRTIGMIAVGNRDGGYRQKDLDSLETLAPTIVGALYRKRAEKALRESEEKYRSLFENMSEGIAHCRMLFGEDGHPADFIYLDVNSVFTKLTGLENVVGKRVTEVIPGIRESYPELFDTYGRVAMTGQPVKFEIEVKSLGIWFSISVHSTQREHFVAVFDNITDRKRSEELLLRSEKLASVGRMAATIAHEINNPLEAVTNVLFLAKTSQDMSSARQYLETADEELNRIAHITRQSLGFYRESNAPALTSVNVVLESAVDLLKNKIKTKQAVIEKQWESNEQITAIAGELRQVFSNLLANSLDAIEDKGIIKLRVSTGAATNSHRYTRVTVADSGKGISADVRQHLFEPLFTTKGTVGTGLGLWVSKQIIDTHGGSIRVRSSTNGSRRGTTISILLPAQPAARNKAAGT